MDMFEVHVGCLDGKLRLWSGETNLGKLVKWAGSCECVLIKIRGLWRCALVCALSKQDWRLVTKPVNNTMLASLSVNEQD